MYHTGLKWIFFTLLIQKCRFYSKTVFALSHSLYFYFVLLANLLIILFCTLNTLKASVIYLFFWYTCIYYCLFVVFFFSTHAWCFILKRWAIGVLPSFCNRGKYLFSIINFFFTVQVVFKQLEKLIYSLKGLIFRLLLLYYFLQYVIEWMI